MILAFLALEFSLINETVFVALVSTALVTSILSGPLIKWAMAPATAKSLGVILAETSWIIHRTRKRHHTLQSKE